MIYRILRRLISRHLLLHLLIPILIGLAVEVVIERWHQTNEVKSWPSYIFSYERIGFFAGGIAAYLVIAFFLLYRETNIQITHEDLVELSDVLRTAASYFAVSATPLQEWFEPYTQVYFSEIVSRQMTVQNFRHERVLLFFRQAQLKDLTSDFLDGLYAKAFRDLHQNYKIPLAFLRPEQLHAILTTLSCPDLAALGCIPRLLCVVPKPLINICIRSRRRIPALAFAVVEDQNGAHQHVVKFAKHGVNVNLRIIGDPQSIRPFVNLMNSIRAQTHDQNGAIRPGREFAHAFF